MFAASCDDHHQHHHHSDSPGSYRMPPRGEQQQLQGAGAQAASRGGEPCAACGCIATKKCSGCKRVRYCSQGCQSKHWQSGHKFKCKQMKKSSPADKLSSGDEEDRNKSSVFGPISLVPIRRKLNKVIFPYDEFLKLCNWRDLDYLPCGLLNCGNSCFANVVLQCLSCTRPLAAYLLGMDHSRECYKRHEDWCFLCELQCHIQKASESIHPFAPKNILSHLPNIGGNLGFGRQEDAHEFMRFAIDKMQSACLDEFGGEKAVDPSTQETTLIQHIFGGRLQSQVQCTSCGMVSNRYENMMDLTVEIHGDADSLEECLDQFTAVEWLDGDNKYKCDGCSDYVKAQKRLTVYQAPNILTITLKRFQSGRFGKLNKRVTFPMKLDLTPYMSSTDGSDQYDLYAVVVHLDMLNASFFGHYICYIKNYRGRWYKIDDCKVMAVDEEEVHAQGAYMLLYSRRTARPRPLIAVEELMKHQQQLKVSHPNGQNHLIQEVVPLEGVSSLKPSEDQQVDFESNNISLHPPISTVPLALDENTRADSGFPLEDSTTMRSVQFGNSTCETSLVHSSAEQCEARASCVDSVDYMEIDTEAGVEVERWSRPVSSDFTGVMDNTTLVPALENGFAGKPIPSRINPSFAEGYQIGDNGAGSSQELNGHCDRDFSCPEQGGMTNSGNTSSPSTQCYGNKFATSTNGNYSIRNGDTLSSSNSLHVGKQNVGFNGFNPKPYTEPSGSNADLNKCTPNLPAKDSQGDMPFLHHGFLLRHCSSEKAGKRDDGLPFNNATSSSFMSSKSSNISSSQNGGGKAFSSPSFHAKHCREAAATDTSASPVHDVKTNYNISLEQKSNGAAVSSDLIKESWSPDCTTFGTFYQQRATSGDNASSRPDENGHATFVAKNFSHEGENGSNGIVDLRGGINQRDGIGSKITDQVDFISDALEHDSLRRRITSNFPDQNGIDAQ
uniref:USP domain-containing protein n=3 Tax=Oryza brachyantha TaxID=4533 RepID=J3MGF1_ORYBR